MGSTADDTVVLVIKGQNFQDKDVKDTLTYGKGMQGVGGGTWDLRGRKVTSAHIHSHTKSTLSILSKH